VLLEKVQSSGTYVHWLPSGGLSNVFIICFIVTVFVASAACTCSNSNAVHFDHFHQCRHVVCIVIFHSKLVTRDVCNNLYHVVGDWVQQCWLCQCWWGIAVIVGDVHQGGLRWVGLLWLCQLHGPQLCGRLCSWLVLPIGLGCCGSANRSWLALAHSLGCCCGACCGCWRGLDGPGCEKVITGVLTHGPLGYYMVSCQHG